ncbi:hypothetical protein ABT56_05635 [Photobacterium aquae]|uniref:Haloacid dehalogenase n=1 Tax=Photobacterium aquae TaxID=1195763 RepID=A0A0J1H5M6_9GAMM|nr:HAD family phosphatase [Photobacterium aquae]KLV07045.1 hypothetical protein ABT56_05635 [Photobacterium aquae]
MQAVCFDFDGTLVDSEVFHAGNWSQYFARYGVEVSPADFLKEFAGVPWEKVAAAFHEAHGLAHCPTITVRDMEALTFDALVAGLMPVRPGAEDMIKQLHGSLPLAVVTGAPRHYVEGILGKLGWLAYFDHIVCGEDVISNKPSPDIYLLACERLGLPTDKVVAIEDSETGAQSAHSAGLRLVVVNDLHSVGVGKTNYRYPTLTHASQHQSDWLVA